AAEAKAKPTPKPVEIVFDQIRQRLSLLPVGIDVRYQTISPDGKWVLMIAAVANQLNLYVYPLDELSKDPFVARQLPSTAGGKSEAQVSPESSAQPATIGRLGVRFDREEYERAGALRITEVIPLSPAAIGKIKPGEYLLAVDGRQTDARANLDELLAYKINRRVALTIASSAAGAQK